MSEWATPQHYVLITVGTDGDLYPFMRLAKTLQSMGRRVTLISNAFHRRVAEGADIPFIGLGTDDDYLRFIGDPLLWHPSKGFESVMSQYEEQLLQTVDAVRIATVDRGPAVALAFPFSVPGAMMAKELGMLSKVASVYLAPSTLRTCHHPMRIGDHIVPRWVPVAWRKILWRLIETKRLDPIGLDRINSARRVLGLSSINTSFLDHLENAPAFTTTMFPAWFAPTLPDWPRPLVSGDFLQLDVRPPSALSKSVSDFLDGGDAPLVFTPGTGNVHARDFFSCALEATRTLGERAIFLTQERRQVPQNLPSSVLWQSYTSLSALLPHTKLLIHHGGIGTTAEALRTGTPQLVVSFGWDQFDNGARAAELDAGMVMAVKNLTPSRLAKAIRTLGQSEDIRQGCAQAAARFSQRQDPLDLCKSIENQFLQSAVA